MRSKTPSITFASGATAPDRGTELEHNTPALRPTLARARFALTFDDGPGPSTAALLDCLALAKVSATFFVLGTNIEEARWCGGDVTHAESVVLRMLREGHLVGNHTWSHMSRDDAALDLGRFRTDLLRGEHAIRRLLLKCGLDGHRFVPFRLPYGPQSPAIIDGQLESPLSADPRLGELRKLGLSHSHWSGGFQDWAPVSGGEEELCRQLCEHTAQEVARGRDAVLLLHDGGPPGAPGSVSLDRSSTVHGVRRFLDRAKALGWQHFVFAAAHAGQ